MSRASKCVENIYILCNLFVNKYIIKYYSISSYINTSIREKNCVHLTNQITVKSDFATLNITSKIKIVIKFATLN